MRDNFLRRPRGAMWIADALRALGVIGVVVAAVFFGPTDAGIVAFALPALMIPRMLGVTPGLDVAAGAAILVAAWSNVLGAYTRLPGWDLLVHAATTALLAVLAYLALGRIAVVPGTTADPRATRILLPIVGLALSAIWEMVEWAGWRFISDAIYVAYQDTIGDMVAGGAGSALLGLVVARVPVLRSDAR